MTNRERHRVISRMAWLDREILKWENSWSDEDELDAAKYMVSKLNNEWLCQKTMLDRETKGTKQ
jgi:hypothetical protein